MSATRYLLAAMVLGSAISATQANAQCSGNAGGCLTVNTASATVNALVKLGMSGTTTTLTSPTADQVEVGATLADAGPSFTVKANRSWTLNIRTSNAASWTYVGTLGGSKPISDLTLEPTSASQAPMHCSFPEQLPPTGPPHRRSSRQCGPRDSRSPAMHQVLTACP